MRGAERIVHVQIAESRERFRERVVVLFLARVEARVLQEQNLAVLELLRRRDRVVAVRALDEHDTRATSARQALGNRGKRILGFGLASLRPPEVREQHDARAASSSASIVGSAARIRVSSVTVPLSSSGTLKSTRTSARFPRTSASVRSRMVRLEIMASELLADGSVADRRRAAPRAARP